MSSRGCYGAGGRSGTAQLAHETKNYPELMSATVQVRMTDPHLKEFVAATGALNAARRHRYEALSVALAAGHPQHVVAAAAGMSPSALSRMIRQDTARSPDRRLLPGLRAGRVDGRTVRWICSAPSPSTSREGRGPECFRRKRRCRTVQPSKRRSPPRWQRSRPTPPVRTSDPPHRDAR